MGVRLADGRHAYADHADPIVAVMRRINRAISFGQPRRPDDDAAVAAWLDQHETDAASCLAGACGHTVA